MTSKFTLKNGQLFVLAEAAGGVYNSDQIRRICEMADEESAFIKVTEDQRIGFMLAAEKFETVKESLSDVGLSLRSYRESGPLSPKVCLGELCPFAQQDAMGDGVDLSVKLTETFGANAPLVSIGVNGCEHACVGSAVDDIHIVGEESGYKIAIGGRTREFPQLGQFLTENVERERLSLAVEAILQTYISNREGDERICDVMERVGTGLFANAVYPSEASEADVETSDLGETALIDEPALIEDAELSLDEADDLLLDDGVSLEESSDLKAEAAPDLETVDPVLDEDLPVAEENISLESDAAEELLLEDDGDSLEAGATENEEELLSEEDTLDVPLEGEDGTPIPGDAELDDIPLDEDLREKLDGPALDDNESLVDDGPLSSTVVDVDEELKSVESRKAVVREMNAEIEGDLTLEGADEELLLDENEPAAMEEEMIDDPVSEGGASPAVMGPDGITMDDADLNVACEEGTLEDVARMREAIRSEVAMDEGLAVVPSPHAPPELDMAEVVEREMEPEPQLEPEPQAAAPIPLTRKSEPKKEAPAAAPVRKVMPRLKVKMGETEVRVTLPSGIECAVPLDWLSSEGAFEMDVGDQTLVVERSGDMIHFKYGTLALSIPTVVVAA